MGAYSFTTIGKGKSAREAFQSATEQARYEHGHGGYTGTIAEKSDFTVIRVPFAPATDVPAEQAAKDYRKAAMEFASKLMEEDDARISDKWGPAGCIDLKDGSYLFFGYASS